MFCDLLAEISLLQRDDVLIGVVQLAGHMLTACTAAHRSLSAWVTAAASATADTATAQAASVADSAPCDVIDLTADDDESGSSQQHAADTEAAIRQELSQPPSAQCKTEPNQQAALPEQDVQDPQVVLSKQDDNIAQQAGILLQPTSALPNQAVVPEPLRAGNASQAEAASTSRKGVGEGRPPLPRGEGALGEGQACLPPGEGAMGEGQGPLALGEGIMEDLCMLCAYGMDMAALLGCLFNQVDTWSGTAHCRCKKEMQLQSL